MKKTLAITSHQTAKTRIIENSKRHEEFSKCITEWRVISYSVDKKGKTVCACEKTNLKHVFTIENRYTAKQLTVGEICLDRLFSHKYNALANYLKRSLETKTWLPTESLVDFGIREKYITEKEGDVIKEQIAQRSRVTGLPIHERVRGCSRKLLVNLMTHGGMSEKVIFKILSYIPVSTNGRQK